MKLTWRDGVETVLGAAAVAVALAVTQGWGWPVLGSPRAGVVALAVLGQGMCSFAGWTRSRWSDPFIVIGSILGVAVLALIVAGLIAGTKAFVLALAVTLGVMWFVATFHHAIQGPASARPALGT